MESRMKDGIASQINLHSSNTNYNISTNITSSFNKYQEEAIERETWNQTIPNQGLGKCNTWLHVKDDQATATQQMTR